jgi:hypothetical protein
MLPGHDKLDGQFFISAGPTACPLGWRLHTRDGLCVAVAQEMRVLPVLDANGDQIGFMLGTPIDLDKGVIVDREYHLDGVLGDVQSLDALIERNVYRLTGSFLFIMSVGGNKRLYLDANGSLSVVYDSERKLAGATAAVLLDPAAYAARFRARLYKALDVENAGWFTAGMTAHEGISRLLCNHYLDLCTWTTKRHWPFAEIETAKDPLAACLRMCDRISRTTAVLAKAGKTTIALTAGNDSRLLLACARSMIADVSFATVAAPTADIDVACATRLAREFGLEHDVLPYREATRAEADLWLLRAGHCVGGNNVKMHPSVKPLEGQYFIGGLGGEVGRGFLWLNAEKDTVIDARGLISRLKLSPTVEVLRAVEEWLAPVSHLDAFLILDLAYIELRMSAWGFCDSYVKPRHCEINPMISRENYTEMLSLPPAMRRKGDIYSKVIALLWREISEIPVNRYGNYRDILRPATEAIRNPKRASRKIRQIVGSWRSRVVAT